jgi:23S rRNA pseudouridine2605 synthase
MGCLMPSRKPPSGPKSSPPSRPTLRTAARPSARVDTRPAGRTGPSRPANGRRRDSDAVAKPKDAFDKPLPSGNIGGASRGGVASPALRQKGIRRKAAPPSKGTLDKTGGAERIAKLLARAGVASRRDVERMIAEGRVAVNGATVETPATALTSLKAVTVDGKPVGKAEATRLFLFHKPAGCVTAARDHTGRKTIYDVLPPDLPRLMPVGRLDLNTEGLLLLTNDGEFKRALELPANAVVRSYRARAHGMVSQSQLEDLIDGVEIEGVRYGSIDANMERRTGTNVWIEMKLTEGKNREVRRVLEHLGLDVSRLIRTSYGPFTLGNAASGAVQEVDRNDLAQLKSTMTKTIKKSS